jgi:2,3,4,5-tetrahydropyridine-2-carboxylate N-succinyltransferase
MEFSQTDIKNKIELAWEYRNLLKKAEVKELILSVIDLLDKGEVRAAYKKDSVWVANEWVKKAILMYFTLNNIKAIKSGKLVFYDKIDVKTNYPSDARVVPNAVARRGVFVGNQVVLMPCYINIGSYIGDGSMIDIGAGIGSCAQIGQNVHVSAGAIIGGVLEPIRDNPVIIEDNAFIGANAVVVEGVIVGHNAVIAAGVTITGSSRIIDVSSEKSVEYKGYVPPYSIVVPGTFTKNFPAGSYNLNCALIIGKVNASTEKKLALNEMLRDS